MRAREACPLIHKSAKAAQLRWGAGDFRHHCGWHFVIIMGRILPVFDDETRLSLMTKLSPGLGLGGLAFPLSFKFPPRVAAFFNGYVEKSLCFWVFVEKKPRRPGMQEVGAAHGPCRQTRRASLVVSLPIQRGLPNRINAQLAFISRPPCSMVATIRIPSRTRRGRGSLHKDWTGRDFLAEIPNWEKPPKERKGFFSRNSQLGKTTKSHH